MRRLSPRVNVIPVVGRADSLTPQELKDFKRRVKHFWTSLVMSQHTDLFIYAVDHGRYRTLQHSHLQLSI